MLNINMYSNTCIQNGGTNGRSGDISKVIVLYLSIQDLLHSASKKSQEVLVSVVFFLIYFAVLSLELQPCPEKNF